MERLQILLLYVLNRYEAHRRPGYRLADRSGVVGIILVAFAIGYDELRAHQLNRVAELLDLARPVVRRAARFHPHQARLQLHQKPEQVLARDTLVHLHSPKGVYSMQSERLLCQVDTECFNLHLGPSPCFCCGWSRLPSWPIMRPFYKTGLGPSTSFYL